MQQQILVERYNIWKGKRYGTTWIGLKIYTFIMD